MCSDDGAPNPTSTRQALDTGLSPPGKAHPPLAIYNPERSLNLKVPRDSRLGLIAAWLAGPILLVVDSLDHQISMLALWAMFCVGVAIAWTCAVVHCYTRRVILEVMSYEHRQQMLSTPVRAMTLVED